MGPLLIGIYLSKFRPMPSHYVAPMHVNLCVRSSLHCLVKYTLLSMVNRFGPVTASAPTHTFCITLVWHMCIWIFVIPVLSVQHIVVNDWSFWNNDYINTYPHDMLCNIRFGPCRLDLYTRAYELMFMAIATLFAQYVTVNNQQLEPWNGDYITTCVIIYLSGIWQGLLVRTNTKRHKLWWDTLKCSKQVIVLN